MNTTLCAQIMMELAATAGLAFLIPVRLTFRHNAAWEIVLSFSLPGDEQVSWTVSRELLLDGLSTVAGEGAVRVRPCRRDDDKVAITLCSPETETQLIAPVAALHAYLLRTDMLRPMGTEFSEEWLDRGLAGLLSETEPNT
jgi:hypothetical protein